jgi:hypothetical protein
LVVGQFENFAGGAFPFVGAVYALVLCGAKVRPRVEKFLLRRLARSKYPATEPRLA